jgi:hypothetical protein
MARYFFHVMDGRALVDREGTELPNMQAVRFEAVRAAGEILADDGLSTLGTSPWTMSVADESGNVVYSLRFQATEHGY